MQPAIIASREQRSWQGVDSVGEVAPWTDLRLRRGHALGENVDGRHRRHQLAWLGLAEHEPLVVPGCTIDEHAMGVRPVVRLAAIGDPSLLLQGEHLEGELHLIDGDGELPCEVLPRAGEESLEGGDGVDVRRRMRGRE